MPFMIALQKTLSPEQPDGKFSGFSKLPYLIQISLSSPLAEDGYGTVTVDGKLLPRGEQIVAMGHALLLLPVGLLAREYDRTYTVRLEGFRDVKGKKFPAKTIRIRTTPRRVQDKRYAAHDEAALQAAREGMVLLKNEDRVLPLPEDQLLNCFGGGQHMFRLSPTGASLINPRWRPTFHEAVAEHSRFRVNRELADYYQNLGAGAPNAEVLRRAREQSDTALIFITRHSGEMQDNRPTKGQYYLTDAEEEMLRVVTETFPKTVVILNIGHPIDLRWLRRYPVQGVIYTGLAGMLSACALVEILDGRTNPSGHLSITLAWDYPDNPANENFVTLGENEKCLGESEKGVRLYYAEDIYMGYRYFDTFGKSVAFPFGFGMSYTDFAISPGHVSWENGTVTAAVTVENTGTAAGKQVVQLYASAPDGRLEKPGHVLIDFAKTRLLQPGEREELKFRADEKRFASFDEENGAWILEKGEYRFCMGTALGAWAEEECISLAQDKMLCRVEHLGCPVETFPRLTKAQPTVQNLSCMVERGEQIAAAARKAPYQPEPLRKQEGKTVKWSEVLADPTLLEPFVAQLTTDELCTLNVNAGPQWLMPWQSGAAGHTAALKKYGLPSYTVADANAGWNLNKPNIGFPASSVIASTFNREIAYMVGKVIGDEGRELGMIQNLGPGMNLQRATLNGRNPEYFSEDPVLAGIMAGFHSQGLEDSGVGSCYKHLFCNNSELCRKASHSIVSERALRELYFKAFEVAFSVHKPIAVMTAYNALNGIYPAESAELLQGLVREEWGFDGYIMTDWDSYDTIDMVSMVNAGTGWISSGGGKKVKELQAAAKAGKVSRAVLERNVYFLLNALCRLSGRRENHGK